MSRRVPAAGSAASIRIRPATPDDLPWIAAWERDPAIEPFISAWPAERHLAAQEGGLPAPGRGGEGPAASGGGMGAPEARDDGGGREAELIVEAGGVPVGFLILAGLGTRVVELRRLAIAAPGRGYGRATIAWVVEHVFADPGVDRVWLDVVPRNARARRLYEAVGFTLDEIRADADIAPDGTRGPLAYYSLRRRAAPGQAGGARRAVGHAPRVQRSR